MNGGGLEKIKSWKEKGYTVYVMGGFRKGDAYIKGKEDGKKHLHEIQMMRSGFPFMIGRDYYLVPSRDRIQEYVEFYIHAVKDGAEAVCPEEPEYFVGAGYEESFKKEWQEFYGEPWQPPHSSVDARVKADRLKGQMYLRMFKSIWEGAKRENPKVKNLLLIHSPVNYSAWGISFPYGDAVRLPVLNEIIGQVWTGTARSTVKIDGKYEERTFENAFCEYSSLWNLIRGTGKNLWFLQDPVEDMPNLPREDYHKNYENTVAASLFFPEVRQYEVMPWPTRIFGDPAYKVPDEYATEIMVVVNALHDVGAQKGWTMESGTTGIATVISDSMMWQRGEPYASSMDSYYGLVMPLLLKGIPVQTLYGARFADKGYLKNTKVLLLSYDAWKPETEKTNEAVAAWVKSGGVLIFFGGNDPYNAVSSWWQKERFDNPKEHLLSLLKKDRMLNPGPPVGYVFQSGKGAVVVTEHPPSFFAESHDASLLLRALVRYAVETPARMKWETPGSMKIQRGRFIVARALTKSLPLTGNFVDLFSPALDVLSEKILQPGENAFLLDLKKLNLSIPRLLASAGRVECFQESKNNTSFTVYAPSGIKNRTRIFADSQKPATIIVTNEKGENLPFKSLEEESTILLEFDNHPDGAIVEIAWESR